MTVHQRLQAVRAVHTAIYLVMGSSAFVLLYAGVFGFQGRWLWLAGGLMGVEVVVFAASGMRCPLTAIAVRNGAAREGVADTFLPERMTRHTFHVFAPLLLLATLLIVGRVLWFGWR